MDTPEQEFDKQNRDAEIIFKAITTSEGFDTYEQVEEAVMLMYFPDLSFSRAGISLALRRLERVYKSNQSD